MSKCDPEFGWFGAGWASYKGRICPDFLPPLNDLQAQYEWLEGFQATWVEYPVLDFVMMNGVFPLIGMMSRQRWRMQ